MEVSDENEDIDYLTLGNKLSKLGYTKDNRLAFLRINLQNMNLKMVNKICQFRHVQFVDISHNEIASLQPLVALYSLVTLNASYNCIRDGPDVQLSLTIQVIDLSYNGMEHARSLNHYPRLKELKLKGNCLYEIAQSLNQNFCLEHLDISENRITSVSGLSPDLPLVKLIASSNRMKSLEGLPSLPFLQIFDISYNLLPNLFGFHPLSFPKLRIIKLAGNHIADLQNIAELERCSQLTELSLLPSPFLSTKELRYQIAHKLPFLSILDGQPYTPEQKVKVDVVYGHDVEHCKAIWKQILPAEPFTDRRLLKSEML